MDFVDGVDTTAWVNGSSCPLRPQRPPSPRLAHFDGNLNCLSYVYPVLSVSAAVLLWLLYLQNGGEVILPGKTVRRAAFRFVYVAGVTVAVAAMVEGGIRLIAQQPLPVMSFHDWDARYLFLPKPHAVGRGFYASGPDKVESVPVRLSSLGLRDGEFGPKKNNEFRIFMLGDSYTFGNAVRAKDSVPGQLAQLLATLPLSMKVTVINGGCAGSGPIQQLGVLLERGLALQPDLVIHQICPSNDIEDSLLLLNKRQRAYNREAHEFYQEFRYQYLAPYRNRRQSVKYLIFDMTPSPHCPTFKLSLAQSLLLTHWRNAIKSDSALSLHSRRVFPRMQSFPKFPERVSGMGRLRLYGRIFFDRVRQVARRTRTRGWRHGWVCAKTQLVNAALRALNKYARPFRASCPCCGWRGYGFRWVDCGAFAVPWVECPDCHAQERQRLMHLFLERRPPAFMKRAAGAVLHFAPEQHITRFFGSRPGLRCIATDYARHMVAGRGLPGVQADMQALPFRDESFDGIFCLHVLEHVPDDRRGIAELMRALTAEGQAVIMVPFMMGWPATVEFENPDPDQFDHVRGYSPLDFKERLAGAECEELFPLDIISREEAALFQIPLDSQAIYLCRKRSDSPASLPR